MSVCILIYIIRVEPILSDRPQGNGKWPLIDVGRLIGSSEISIRRGRI